MSDLLVSFNARRPIWLDSLSDSEAVFLGSLVILGGFVAMGQRVKNTMMCVISHTTVTLCGKKNTTWCVLHAPQNVR